MSFKTEKGDQNRQSDLLTIKSDDDGAKPSKLLDRQGSFVENQITEKFQELRQLREELNKAFIQWIPKRKHTKEQLEKLASKLHAHHRHANITTATGASMGTVGGVLSIAGLIAAPFTFGAGIAVSLIGAGIGGAGGLLMSGSKIAEIILTKSGVKDVQQTIDEDSSACTDLQQQLDALESFISDLAGLLKPIYDDAELMKELEESDLEFLNGLLPNDNTTPVKEKVKLGTRFFRTITSTATVSASAVATTSAFAWSAALAGTRAAHMAGPAISAVLIPLDITLLVKSSLELHRGSTSQAVEDVRKILDELECPGEDEIEMFVESFINEKFSEFYNEIDYDEEQEESDEDTEENVADFVEECTGDDNNN